MTVSSEKEPVVNTTFSEFAGSDEAFMNQGFLEENRAFIDAIKSGKQLHNNLQDAVKSMDLVDKIYANSITG